MQDVLISKSETIQEVLVNATRALGTTMEYHCDAASRGNASLEFRPSMPRDDASARLQAELLLAHALKTTRAMVLARLDEALSAEVAVQYAASVARRAQHEPLAYILGRQEFCGLDFIVDRRVLIPRHETEMLVQLALERARRAPTVSPVIVDVGTGSGAVALTLAKHLSQARIVATDISHDALNIARMNAKRLNLDSRVGFVESDLLERIAESFDLLVANLPYIPSRRFARLPREVRAFEPRIALDGGEDGLDVFRRLLAQLESRAARGAVALLEISEEQGRAAMECVWQVLPHVVATLHRDLEGLDRVVEIQNMNNDKWANDKMSFILLT